MATVIGGANVLVFVPMPMKSHFRGFQPLFEELSRRGHNLTVASSFPLEQPVANYTDIGPFVTGARSRYATVRNLCAKNQRQIILFKCFYNTPHITVYVIFILYIVEPLK